MKALEKSNDNRNEEGIKNNIRRKNEKSQTNNIVSFNVKVCMLYHNLDKEQVLDIESKFSNKNIEFVNNLANVKGNRKRNLLRQFDYLVVILSSKCLEDYTLMRILVDNFDIGKSSKNRNIIPIIIEQDLYEPEKRNEIIQSWIVRSKIFEQKFFRGNFGDDITETLKKMQQISEMLQKFLKFSIDKDIKCDEEPYLRLIKKIEENGGIIHESLIKKIEENDGIIHESLFKKNEENSGMIHEWGGVVVNNDYKNCIIVEAKGHSTVHATQNNGISKNELKEIIDIIVKNLDKLNQEDADDLQDTLSMVVEEFDSEAPRTGRLRKCFNLLAPMITVTNGIPVLAQNLQKVYDYILPFIN